MKVTNYATTKSGTKHAVIAVACENCGHIMVVKTGKNVTSFKTLSTIAKELITDCPACGEKVTVREKMSVFGSLAEHKDAAGELFDKLKADYEENQYKEIKSLVDGAKKPKDLPPDNPIAAEIRGDIDKMRAYLDAVIRLETDSRLLVSRINSLSRMKMEERTKMVDAHMDALTKNRRATTVATNKTKDLEAEIEQLENSFANKDWDKLVKVRKAPKPKEPEYLDVTLPAKPARPVLKQPNANGVFPGEPPAPMLKTPGLFNKKKILEENELILAQYRNAVTAYRNTCLQENADKIASYEAAVARWKNECDAAEQRKLQNKELEAAYLLKLQKYEESAAQRQEKAYADMLQQKEAARAELDEKIAEIREKIAELGSGDGAPKLQMQVSRFFDLQMEILKQRLKAVTAEKNRLYSLNVLYPTYRELVAESSIYEYFSSGRCDTLDGPHGAYNMFESECRSDVIARIIRSLDEVRQSQVILFRQMKQVHELQSELNKTLDKALPFIRKVDEDQLEAYLEENRSKGQAEANSKDTAVVKYFRVDFECEDKINKDIENAGTFAV